MSRYELRVFLKGEKDPVVFGFDKFSHVRVVTTSLFELPNELVDHIESTDHTKSCPELGSHHWILRRGFFLGGGFCIIAVPIDREGDSNGLET